MDILPNQINDLAAGPLVRLPRDNATVQLDRWPGPHRPNEVIHSSHGGLFLFERIELSASGDLEIVYTSAT